MSGGEWVVAVGDTAGENNREQDWEMQVLLCCPKKWQTDRAYIRETGLISARISACCSERYL